MRRVVLLVIVCGTLAFGSWSTLVHHAPEVMAEPPMGDCGWRPQDVHVTFIGDRSGVTDVTLHARPGYWIMLSCVPLPEAASVRDALDAPTHVTLAQDAYREVRVHHAAHVDRYRVALDVRGGGNLTVSLAENGTRFAWNGTDLPVTAHERVPLPSPVAWTSHEGNLTDLPVNGSFEVPDRAYFRVHVTLGTPATPFEAADARLRVRIVDPTGEVVWSRPVSGPYGWAGLSRGLETPGTWRLELEGHAPDADVRVPFTLRYAVVPASLK